MGSRTANTGSTDLGRIDVSIETIKTLPALMGEVDVLKAIQLLPVFKVLEKEIAAFT